MASVPAVLQSEWTKIRTVSSTIWTLAVAFLVTVAMGVGLSALFNSTFGDLSAADRATFDPTFISFSGMILGQLAMVVFGVLVVGSEYSSGMIRTSLAAVPQRGTFLFSKLLVAGGWPWGSGSSPASSRSSSARRRSATTGPRSASRTCCARSSAAVSTWG